MLPESASFRNQLDMLCVSIDDELDDLCGRFSVGVKP